VIDEQGRAAVLTRKPYDFSRSEKRRTTAFPGWKVTDVEVADTEPDVIARVLRFDEHWYRLRRE
jgi:hypothetical protein